MTDLPRVALYTPTFHYGGLDVNYASIQRQDYEGEIVWIIGDELFAERETIAAETIAPTQRFVHFQPSPVKEGNPTNLAASYNDALDIAWFEKAEVFFSFQDYFWLPPNAVSQFVDSLLELDMKHLITGFASLTNDPYPTQVVDPEGLWTIFGEDYTDKPTDIWWKDVRQDYYPFSEVQPCSIQEWESNFSAVPMEVVHRAGARYDEDFDQGVAYENQDFAWQCRFGGDANTYIEPRVHVYGLPHKHYWPEEERVRGPYTMPNKDRLEQKWNSAYRMINTSG